MQACGGKRRKKDKTEEMKTEAHYKERGERREERKDDTGEMRGNVKDEEKKMLELVNRGKRKIKKQAM